MKQIQPIIEVTLGEKKTVNEINFYLDNEFVISYSCIDNSQIAIDDIERSITLDRVKKFKYQRATVLGQDQFKANIGKIVFTRILMYCASRWNYTDNSNDKDEIDVIVNILNKLHK